MPTLHSLHFSLSLDTLTRFEWFIMTFNFLNVAVADHNDTYHIIIVIFLPASINLLTYGYNSTYGFSSSRPVRQTQ